MKVEELAEPRAGTTTSRSRAYRVSGSTDLNRVLEAALDHAPSRITVLNRVLLPQLDEIQTDEYKGHDDNSAWKVIIPYATSESQTQLEDGEMSWQFDTTGQTTTRRLSLETVTKEKRSDLSGDPKDFKGGIRANDQGFDGAEIVTGGLLNFSIVKNLSISTIRSSEFYTRIVNATGKVNDSSWEGWDPQEVLFLGARGRYSTKTGQDGNVEERSEVEFFFQGSKNVDNLNLPDFPAIEKKGHEFVWEYYPPEKPSGETTLIRRPASVYVEKVYEETDFSGLMDD